MIVDTSALLAVFLMEPDGQQMRETMLAADTLRMSVASYLEAGLLVAGRPTEGDLDLLIEHLRIALEPVTIEQARAARDAARRFGKGHHTAALNFGDCFSYALAKVTGEPLLFKGNDFSQTDIRIACLTG